MDTCSEHKNLADRYAKMQAGGLVDVKFLLSNAGETTAEEVCREVNALYAAVERGDTRELDFGDLSILQ
ncbi:MAG: hypothetical protein QHC65_14140 [Sphingomonas sp.]|nr:hypothetical protein [Sphingomonas sp.]MDX3885557.1 hypothetical protein [Sphingomonas sp.]